MSKEIYYSDKYEDDKFEYRHVMLPKVILNLLDILSSEWAVRFRASPP